MTTSNDSLDIVNKMKTKHKYRAENVLFLVPQETALTKLSTLIFEVASPHISRPYNKRY